MICDFGMARVLPSATDEEKILKDIRKTEYKNIMAASSDKERLSYEQQYRHKVSK
jgi:hypothetical protein